MAYLDEKKRLIANLTRESAEPFLRARGYFTEIDILPGYVNPDSLDNITPPPINWRHNGGSPRTSSIDILIEKPDKGLRRFSLVHPLIYLQMMEELFASLDLVKNRLLRETGVSVYSIPTMIGHEEVGEGWKYFSRIDPAQHFLSHGVVVSADIYNFYGSVYTHSVSWALHGRDEAKNRSRDFSLSGNRFDKLLQNAHDGQTNGIPVGNIISDVMAELVLKDVDELIAPLLLELDVKAFRFKDDYRFICKSKRDARAVIDKLALSLNTHYGLSLNQSKTKIQFVDDYLRSTLDPQGLGPAIPISLERSGAISGLEFYEFVKLARDGAVDNKKGFFDAQLKRLVDYLRERSDENLTARSDLDDWAHLTTVIIIDAIDMGYSTAGHAYLIIDLLMDKLDDIEVRKRLEDTLIEHAVKGSNVARQLWTYALLLNHDRRRARRFASSSPSPLLRIATNPSIQQVSVFDSRDEISERVLAEFEGFRLINFDLFGRINGRGAIFSVMENDLYESMASFHYDD